MQMSDGTLVLRRQVAVVTQLLWLGMAACGGQPEAPMPNGAASASTPAAATNPAAAPAGMATAPATAVVAPNTTAATAAANPGSAAPAPNPVSMPTAGSAAMNNASAMAGGASAAANAAPAAPARLPASLYDSATRELRAPATGDGVQITTPMFDLEPGQERFTCYHTEVPIDGEIDVHYYESKMATGSHHFILYKNDNDTARLGTMDQTGCLTAFQNWIYSSAQPHIDLRMPDGVAMVLNSRQRVLFDMHYINTSDKALHAQVMLNVVLAKGKFEKAASLISYNTSIRVPAHGMQTVAGDCTPGPGAKFFYMLTHTHARGKLATITRVMSNGMMGEELVRSTDWEVPMERKWLDAPLLTFQQGEKFHYKCDFENNLDQVVTSGPSAATNEMCMAITYYYPASAGGSCL
jgi:hypothetical protein